MRKGARRVRAPRFTNKKLLFFAPVFRSGAIFFLPKIAQSARIVAQSETATDGNGNLLMFATRYYSDGEFNRAMNIGLKEVGKLCKIEKLTTYHARHTWATLARNEVGVTLGDVGEALNHSPRGSERVTDIYVERDFSRVWDTNRKVLDLVFSR